MVLRSWESQILLKKPIHSVTPISQIVTWAVSNRLSIRGYTLEPLDNQAEVDDEIRLASTVEGLVAGLSNPGGGNVIIQLESLDLLYITLRDATGSPSSVDYIVTSMGLTSYLDSAQDMKAKINNLVILGFGGIDEVIWLSMGRELPYYSSIADTQTVEHWRQGIGLECYDYTWIRDDFLDATVDVCASRDGIRVSELMSRPNHRFFRLHEMEPRV